MKIRCPNPECNIKFEPKPGQKKCFYCGVSLSNAKNPALMAKQKKQERKGSRGCLIVLGVLLALSILAGIIGSGKEGKKSTPAQKQERHFTKEEVLEARKLFSVEVVDYDASQCYGEESNCADYVKLKISNGSKITLPYLTVKTIRYDKNGKVIGWSRAPSIPTSNIKPGETLTYDYYPLGHFYPFIAEVEVIKVEIEHIVSAESEKFFKELTEKSLQLATTAQKQKKVDEASHGYKDFIEASGMNKYISSVKVGGPNGRNIEVMVRNNWHYNHKQVRLQAAQTLWKAWATLYCPEKETIDLCRITLVDLNGNKVGGSSALAGSIINVID